MLVGMVDKQRLEVRTAGRQYHLVGTEQLALDSERDVDEALVVQQLVEDGEQVGLVVVPAQAEALRGHGGGRRRPHAGVVVVRWEAVA